jgi:transcriptional regulator with XRE-family HTH domain
MKRRYKKYTQEDFGKQLGIPQCRVSRILNGQESVSWPLASTMASIFPEKDTDGWKKATLEELAALYEREKEGAE